MAAEGSEKPQAAEALSASEGLNASLVKAWASYLMQATKDAENPFYPLAALAGRTDSTIAHSFSGPLADIRRDLLERISRANTVHAEQKIRGDIIFEDFERLSYEGWTVSGQAFGDAPQRETPSNQTLRGYLGQGVANSFHLRENSTAPGSTWKKLTQTTESNPSRHSILAYDS